MPVLNYGDYENLDFDQRNLKKPSASLRIPEIKTSMETPPIVPGTGGGAPAEPIPAPQAAPSESRSLMQRGQMSNALATMATAIGPNSFGGRLGAGVLDMNQRNVANARAIEQDEQGASRNEAYIRSLGIQDQLNQKKINAEDRTIDVPGIGPVSEQYADKYMKKPDSVISDVSPKDYTAESMQAFSDSAAGGKPDYSLLKPVPDSTKERSLNLYDFAQRAANKDPVAIETLRVLEDYNANIEKRKADASGKETKADKELKALESNFFKTMGWSNSAYKGVDMFSAQMQEKTGEIAANELNRAKQLAVQYVGKGGDPKNLGLVTRETQAGTFIQTGPDEWTRVK